MKLYLISIKDKLEESPLIWDVVSASDEEIEKVKETYHVKSFSDDSQNSISDDSQNSIKDETDSIPNPE